MKTVHVLLVLLALLAGHAALAAGPGGSARSHFFVGPAPAWVRPSAVPAVTAHADTAGQSVRYLLSERQVRIGPEGQTVYHHAAFVPLTEDGLADRSNIKIVFNPAYQDLIIHAIDIVRHGRRINKLHKDKVRLIQRETDIDQLLYDGTVTAFVALDDVRIGDVVEYSYSIKGSNPVFGKKFFRSFSLGWSVPIDRVVVRVLVPPQRKLHWHVYNMTLKPKVDRFHGYRELTWTINHQPGLDDEGDYPRWYEPYPWLQITEYDNWKQVVDWARGLYQYHGRLQAGLRAKVNAWKRLDRKVAVAKALHFVQSKIRYFGVELGQNSHRPHDPNQVYRDRYGDCKDKALLLTALLRAMGVKASPALVSADFGKGIAKWLPSPGLFDHVIVVAQVDGRRYWLDGTRSYQDGSLDRIDPPDFGYGLPVAPWATGLVAMNVPRDAVPTIDVEESFRASSYYKPVRFTVKSVYTGGEAERQRYNFSNNTIADIGRHYLNYYARTFPGITALQPVHMQDDRRHDRVVVTEHYSIPHFWDRQGDKLHFDLTGSTLYPYTQWPNTVARTAPLGLTYPIRVVHKTVLMFPRVVDFHSKGSRLTVDGPDVHYTRIVIHDGRMLEVEHRYRSERDAVMPKTLPQYLKHLRAIRDDLDYAAWVRVPERPAVLIGKLLKRLGTYGK